jgi:hypothetical protein
LDLPFLLLHQQFPVVRERGRFPGFQMVFRLGHFLPVSLMQIALAEADPDKRISPAKQFPDSAIAFPDQRQGAMFLDIRKDHVKPQIAFSVLPKPDKILG